MVVRRRLSLLASSYLAPAITRFGVHIAKAKPTSNGYDCPPYTLTFEPIDTLKE